MQKKKLNILMFSSDDMKEILVICYDTSLSRNEDTDCEMCWKLALEEED